MVRKERTLKKKVSFSGIGIHTGETVTMTFRPAKRGGIQFKRIDLPGMPVVPATLNAVSETARNTTLSLGDVKIYTVEHVLAALEAFSIDHLIIELSGVEPPVGDGSSSIFVEMLEEGEIEELSTFAKALYLKEPIYFSEGFVHLVALPSEHYKISYVLDYPEASDLPSQFYSFDFGQKEFKEEIAPCRTFSLYEEVSVLMDKGLIKGGSLDNALVIKEGVIFSKEGMRFPNELARHKILDLIGDLSLIGADLFAHVIAIRSGHTTHWNFAKQLNALKEI